MVSILIVAHLFVVGMGPLSNPIASENLTGPISRWLAPVQQALFLGHGYRFFGPDPGPSHLLVYKISTVDGKQIEGRIPDKNQHWPRLMYHRWFMLSETIFEEHAYTPDLELHLKNLKEMDSQIAQLKHDGRTVAASDLQGQRNRQVQQYEMARARIDKLMSGVAQYLLQVHDGQSIELFVQERLIPLPQDVVDGVRLNDPRYLSPPQKIAVQNRRAAGKSADETSPVVTPESGKGN